MSDPIHIGFLVYPELTQLDATGPAQVLSRLPGARMHFVWKTRTPVPTDAGFALVPTATFATCPPLDVLCVPGGTGQLALMRDSETLAFLDEQGRQAKYVTSVCTGSLLLGAAGLLEGYRATCHWGYRSLLSRFGATPVAERVVRDRNRWTGGGVTSGIDFGLALAAEIAGEETAKRIQLALEYDPAPPFSAGSPEIAGDAIAAPVRARYQARVAEQLALLAQVSPT